MSRAKNIAVLGDNNLDTIVADGSGNVGIGTSSPAAKLDVVGGTTSGAVDIVALLSGGAGGVTGSGAALHLSGSASLIRGAVITAVNTTGNGNGHALTFSTSASSSAPTERVRIDASGAFLVGTTTEPNGTENGCSISSVGSRIVSRNSTSNRVVDQYFNPNGQVGGITVSGSATTFATSSDYRLKENVVPMTGALEKVAQLNPVTYTWKADGSAGEGFIAHELQAVCPIAVTGTKDAVGSDGKPEYQAVDTSFLVATLTAAIQELKTELDAAKSRISALEAA